MSQRVTTAQHSREVRRLYQKHFGDAREERQIVSAAPFFSAFGAVRGITHAIRAEVGPFHMVRG